MLAALGQAERLRVYLALDQFAALPAQEEKEQNLRAAVRHSTLSLHYWSRLPQSTRS